MQHTTNILLVDPGVHHPNVQKIGECAGAGGRHHFTGEILIACGGQCVSSLGFNGLPLGKHFSTSAAASSVNFMLVKFTNRVLNMRQIRSAVGRGRFAM
jgi:hypothetical protein